MKKIWLSLLLFSAVPAFAENVDTTLPENGNSSATPAPEVFPLKIVHPSEGAALPGVRRSFVYGWAEPGGTLFMNGSTVAVHPGGGWLAMVDYAPGPNVIHFAYEKYGVAVSLDRRVTVGGGGGGAASGPDTLRPDGDVGAAPGELVPVSFRGAPGGSASFRVAGVKGKFPMTELNGFYRGFFPAPGGTSVVNAKVKVQFKSSKGKGFNREAGGRVTVLLPEAPFIVEVSTSLAILRAGPGFSEKDTAGYVMFPPVGVRLKVTGFQGEEYRVRVTKDRELWIPKKEVRELPRGTFLPPAVTQAVQVKPWGRHALVRLVITQKVPFEVTPSEDLRHLDVTFYGAYSNTDWIHPSADVPWIKDLRWFQDGSEVFRLSIDTEPGAWWGYDARYEDGAFILELRRPPAVLKGKHAPPLGDMTIAVDAGHSPDTGAVGITGSFERDVNRDIAAILRGKLEADGARVVMIREGDAPVYLYDRPHLAWAAGADLLISVHNNALAEGENPFEKNGFGVYYFHPQSQALAREVYGVYQEMFSSGKNGSKTVMRDDGLHWGNLALPRTPQMPAVLTESAYMIYPPEEWALRQPVFQEDCAEAMRRGIERYVKKMRTPSAAR